MTYQLTERPAQASLTVMNREPRPGASGVREFGMLTSRNGSGSSGRPGGGVRSGGGWLTAGALAAAVGLTACTPTIQLAADKPITINLNVKIDQEVRYRIDKDLEDAIAANPDLF